MISRRRMMGNSAIAAAIAPVAAKAAAARVAVRPDLASMTEHWTAPEWFRDAKFGLWSHWGPQCVPEFGDWYGRKMYIQGDPFYEHHLKTYGHPSNFGFMDFIDRWKTDAFDPDHLASRYRAAGAKYIVSMANHHDNLDMFASRHHAWNTTRVGPRLDIVGSWEKAAREAGLRFGVSNHGAHSWHWWQTAYGYDPTGPMRGRRYDAFTRTKAMGRGTWWEGLDPQQLYTGPQADMVLPEGIDGIEAMKAFQDAHSGQWLETVPPGGERFAANWLARQIDLVERYDPDLVYMDNTGLPLERYGLEAAAQFYNQAIARRGKADVVLTGKKLDDAQRGAFMDDVERGFVEDIRPLPWQTCTCIGDWHYSRPLYEAKAYKTVPQIITRLLDVVSKNGNLLLSIPQRGDGSIDSEEEAILDGIGAWMAVNGEAIFATRPWRRFGEGPTRLSGGMMNEGKAGAFTAGDVRFTQRSGTLYAAFMAWPEGEATIATLGLRETGGASVQRVTLLGGGPIPFTQTNEGLHLAMPPPASGSLIPVLKVEGHGLA